MHWCLFHMALMRISFQTHGRSLSVLSLRSILNGHGPCGKGGHVMSISLVISRLHRNLRSGFPKFIQLVRGFNGRSEAKAG